MNPPYDKWAARVDRAMRTLNNVAREMHEQDADIDIAARISDASYFSHLAAKKLASKAQELEASKEPA